MRDFNEYQDQAWVTALPAAKAHEMGLVYTALGLAAEAGEYTNKVKKKLRDGVFNYAAAADELGDVLWYVAMAAYQLDYTLQDIADMNMKKLAGRLGRGVIQGSGDER